MCLFSYPVACIRFQQNYFLIYSYIKKEQKMFCIAYPNETSRSNLIGVNVISRHTITCTNNRRWFYAYLLSIYIRPDLISLYRTDILSLTICNSQTSSWIQSFHICLPYQIECKKKQISIHIERHVWRGRDKLHNSDSVLVDETKRDLWPVVQTFQHVLFQLVCPTESHHQYLGWYIVDLFIN